MILIKTYGHKGAQLLYTYIPLQIQTVAYVYFAENEVEKGYFEPNKIP